MADDPPVTDCDFDTAVPDWIIEHPATLSVFQEFGIDYSCGGKSLGYACDQLGLDREMVLAALHSKTTTSRTPKGSSTVIKAEVSDQP